LIAAALKAAAASEGKTITAIHPEAMERLLLYPWPGNLRELSHTVRTMTLFCDGSVILPEHVIFPPDLKNSDVDGVQEMPGLARSEAPPVQIGRDLSLAGAVARHVRFVYEQTDRNQRRTARVLGISRATLVRHLRNMAQK
jgi:two-component system, NtrC family, response regulator HydG